MAIKNKTALSIKKKTTIDSNSSTDILLFYLLSFKKTSNEPGQAKGQPN